VRAAGFGSGGRLGLVAARARRPASASASDSASGCGGWVTGGGARSRGALGDFGVRAREIGERGDGGVQLFLPRAVMAGDPVARGGPGARGARPRAGRGPWDLVAARSGGGTGAVSGFGRAASAPARGRFRERGNGEIRQRWRYRSRPRSTYPSVRRQLISRGFEDVPLRAIMRPSHANREF
jgi:hypothetical protein